MSYFSYLLSSKVEEIEMCVELVCKDFSVILSSQTFLFDFEWYFHDTVLINKM